MGDRGRQTSGVHRDAGEYAEAGVLSWARPYSVGRYHARCNDHELTRWVLERSGQTWDELEEPHASWEDLDPAAIGRFRRLCLDKGRRAIPADETDPCPFGRRRSSTTPVLHPSQTLHAHSVRDMVLFPIGHAVDRSPPPDSWCGGQEKLRPGAIEVARSLAMSSKGLSAEGASYRFVTARIWRRDHA